MTLRRGDEVQAAAAVVRAFHRVIGTRGPEGRAQEVEDTEDGSVNLAPSLNVGILALFGCVQNYLSAAA